MSVRLCPNMTTPSHGGPWLWGLASVAGMRVLVRVLAPMPSFAAGVIAFGISGLCKRLRLQGTLAVCVLTLQCCLSLWGLAFANLGPCGLHVPFISSPDPQN